MSEHVTYVTNTTATAAAISGTLVSNVYGRWQLDQTYNPASTANPYSQALLLERNYADPAQWLKDYRLELKLARLIEDLKFLDRACLSLQIMLEIGPYEEAT